MPKKQRIIERLKKIPKIKRQGKDNNNPSTFRFNNVKIGCKTRYEKTEPLSTNDGTNNGIMFINNPGIKNINPNRATTDGIISRLVSLKIQIIMELMYKEIGNDNV